MYSNMFPDIPPWVFIAFLICAAIGFMAVVCTVIYLIFSHIQFV